jgi:hypothetical protein
MEAKMARENNTPSNTIQVSVAAMMSEIRTYILPDNSTVADALSAAGFPTSSEIRIRTADGNTQNIVSTSAILDDGDFITVIQNSKVDNA